MEVKLEQQSPREQKILCPINKATQSHLRQLSTNTRVTDNSEVSEADNSSRAYAHTKHIDAKKSITSSINFSWLILR